MTSTTRRDGDVRIGCSGWMYDDWRGLVYPPELPKRSWLGCYANRFDTVEVNNTFYRLPTVDAVEHWRDAVPDRFCFAFKLGGFGSHRKKLRDPHSWLPAHLQRMDAAGEHLGPNLVQLPPRWKRNAERLDEFLTAAPTTIRWAVEMRDPSWLHDDVFDVLHRHGAALCVHDLLAGHPQLLTTDWTYVRFHGPDAIAHPYRGRYGRRGLARRARWLRDVRAGGNDVFAYFNNDYEANAVADAATLREMLTKQ